MNRNPTHLHLIPLIGALLCILLGAPSARANGNFSHVWIAVDALQYLEDGALRDLLGREDLRRMLRNGAMFPDGGYAVGDGYGELSHWEPFHRTYLEWIRETYAPPWSDEAARHIAFLMGMTAHGIADQLYDGMYLTRHGHYDEHGSEATMLGVDGATDACFAKTQGAMEPPDPWVPAADLAPLYEVLTGHLVEPDTLSQGQSFVVVAILAANDATTNPGVVEKYMDIYPWGCGHQDDPTAPGSPPTHGPTVASVWQAHWDRLHGSEAFDQPLAGTFATGMTLFDVPMDAGTPDSWVSFVLARGIDPATVSGSNITVLSSKGEAHPVNLHLYYGHNSHLVNIKPQEDWAPDTEYTVTISPLTSWDGETLDGPRHFSFSTGAASVPVDEDPADIADDHPGPEGAAGRSSGTCDQGPGDSSPGPTVLILLGLFTTLTRLRRMELMR